MKISFNWLRELVDLPPGVTADSVAQKLTLAGLEVESIERRGRDVRGVVVAEVRGKRPHPTADKLSIVRLVAGGAEEDVVCGAPNVPAPGGKVAWAAPGAMLPGGRTLDRREIRGVMSPGMICSEDELGIGEGKDGIVILPGDLAVGADLAGAVGLLDEILEVNVTPNRPDALSHAGIAREVAGLFGRRWSLPAPHTVATTAIPAGRGVDVEIRDPAACPRYAARLITGVRIGPSPLALRVRLAACGVRAISNVVDVSNYVMLEAGHPLHAFDLGKLSGGIHVRRAGRGERMTTLDGVDRPLQENDVVIADAHGPVALAGVMGGASSEVSADTVDVLLETATFEPRSVRRTAKRLGMHSEASHRFERGVDANGIPYAGLRAAAMMARLAGGALAGEVVDRYPTPVAPRRVTMSIGALGRLAGFAIPAEQAAERLASIEIPSQVQTAGDDGDRLLVATVPTFRPDITIQEDLIEEVMRLEGYDRVPTRLPAGGRAPAQSPEALADRARDCLAAQGLHEVITWAFVPRGWLAALGRDQVDGALATGVVVKNPISADYEMMRTSLLPGLVDAAKRNLARGATDFGLFEVGPVVRRPSDTKEAPAEPSMAAAIMTGRQPGWLKQGEPLDFFDAKRVFLELAAGLGIDGCRFVGGAAGPLFHPGASAVVQVGTTGDAAGRRLGAVGEMHPALAKALGMETRALYLEIELDAVAGERRAVRSMALPRYPSTTRDISFWIDSRITADQQRAALVAAREALLVSLAVLEDFRDPKYAPAGKKGMLWTLTYRADDRTLTDPEVDAAHARVIAALKAAQAIEVR
ncbi:MAG TPA: phenylalanine--tRNA ligase subunit beta [Polyangia bacterium]|jgi:phenylalanyl-tRNA synthetase beta chain